MLKGLDDCVSEIILPAHFVTWQKRKCGVIIGYVNELSIIFKYETVFLSENINFCP